MKIFARSRLLHASVLPVFAAAFLMAPAANAAAIHHRIPAQGRPFIQSGAQQDYDPVLPTFNQPPDYHPDCFQSRLQVPDGVGGLKWVPHMDCRY